MTACTMDCEKGAFQGSSACALARRLRRSAAIIRAQQLALVADDAQCFHGSDCPDLESLDWLRLIDTGDSHSYSSLLETRGS